MDSDETQIDTGTCPAAMVQRPPANLPGYTTRHFIGAGAYGEVWAAVDRNTGRHVAIKFFAHPSGIDAALVSREVEKLVFLSADRYVVQLLEVGWDADPPYFVMEYVEHGSLKDRLEQSGTLSATEATEIFRGVAIGLSHAHRKGVLHCDLKPANVLLDQDGHPRLADFGQSRLTGEQSPALGTLFFMAPEQSDLTAVPDAQWDVYALGALIYTMLTGEPPYRSGEAVSAIDSESGLAERLQRYQEYISSRPVPSGHRQLTGVDRPLAEIIDRCLALDTKTRFPDVVSVLESLRDRETARRRRPLWLLGLIGPLLLMLIVGVFGYRGYQSAIAEAKEMAIGDASEANLNAAQYVARDVAHELDRRFRAVQTVADNEEFQARIRALLDLPGMDEKLLALADPGLPADEHNRIRDDEFLSIPQRAELHRFLERLIASPAQPPAASWFLTDPRGTHLAIAFRGERPKETPVGDNYAWRTYFHGQSRDLDVKKRPSRCVDQPHLSAVFPSTSTKTWKVAVSVPVVDREKNLLGLLAHTVELGDVVQLSDASRLHSAVLVDGREGDHLGVILEHPLFDTLIRTKGKLPDRFNEKEFRVPAEKLKMAPDAMSSYFDPVANDPLGSDFEGEWVAGIAPVLLEQINGSGEREVVRDTGLLLIMQERQQNAIQPVQVLAHRMSREAVAALVATMILMVGMWFLVRKMLSETKAPAEQKLNVRTDESTIHSRDTLEQPEKSRGVI